MKHPEDHEILELIGKGAHFKSKGIHLLVKKFGPILYRQIQQLTKNSTFTDDCLQNVFLKVIQSIDQFKGESALYSWLYRIARNETLNFLEKEKRRTGIDIKESTFEIIAGHSSLDQLGGKQIENMLFKAIDSLPEKQKIIFELKYLQELKYSEISKLLDTSEGALKASYHHAQKKVEDFLRNELNQ